MRPNGRRGLHRLIVCLLLVIVLYAQIGEGSVLDTFKDIKSILPDIRFGAGISTHAMVGDGTHRAIFPAANGSRCWRIFNVPPACPLPAYTGRLAESARHLQSWV